MTLRTPLPTHYECAICSLDLGTEEGGYLEHIATHRVGYCVKCKRWQPFSAACQRCGSLLDIQYECHVELRHQFAELVMALQDAVPWARPAAADGRPAVAQLDPNLWGIEPADVLWSAVNPLFWSNMTATHLRQAIGRLRGVAGTLGVPLPGQAQGPVEEVEVELPDGRWLMQKVGETYTPIRRVPSLAADAGPPAPSHSSQPIIRSPFTCEKCDMGFGSVFALGKHRKQEHAT